MTGHFHYQDPYPENSTGVLLLHGLGTDSTSWMLQFGGLNSAGFRPIAPDIIGFGQSPYDGRGWSVARVAGLLKDFIIGFGIGPVHVVGLSMGGVLAQQFAIDYPHLVRKLVLASTFSALRPANFNQGLYFLARLLVVHTMGLRAQSKIVSKRIFPNPDQAQLRELVEMQIASANPAVYRAAIRGLGFFNSSGKLKNIKKPVLVIGGENDTTVSVRLQRRLAEGIPGAVQVIVPEGGHALSIDHSELFTAQLVKFLSAPE